MTHNDDYGATLKDSLLTRKPGNWQISAQMIGETIPKETSTVTLDPVKKDRYGLPQLRVHVTYDENDEKMLADFLKQFTQMFARAGFTNIQQLDTERKPGNENHEMGGVRMGNDPKTSLLSKWNQLHGCKMYL